MSSKRSIHGQWSSRWAFILAAAGSAVGLGNIWKFPYITGVNGGGAFVLVYLICIFTIGIPIMMAEVLIGRRGRQSPINSMRKLAKEGRHSPHWQYLGWMGVLAGFLILSYYSVVAGWALAYVFRSGLGMFEGVTADGANAIFSNLVTTPEATMAWHTIFIVMTMFIVARGVASGLEKAVRYLMPALFVLLLILVGYAMNVGDFSRAVSFLFTPNFGDLSAKGLLMAMGHAFFTLSLGMGAIMVYGSYMPAGTSIAKTSIAVALADTLVALLAGLAIFPIVFAYGVDPDSGPSLIFETLPVAFGGMPGGAFFATLFFILLVFAAWTSSISLIEPAVTWLVENRGMSRIAASTWAGTLAWLFGLLSVYSNPWFGSKPGGQSLFESIDFLTSNLMLPIGGMLIAIFAGWIMTRAAVRDELNIRSSTWFRVWYLLVRYFTPVAVLIVIANRLGIIELGNS